MVLMSVDLPQPFGPRMATCSPASMRRFTSCSTTLSPRATFTFSISRKEAIAFRIAAGGPKTSARFLRCLQTLRILALVLRWRFQDAASLPCLALGGVPEGQADGVYLGAIQVLYAPDGLFDGGAGCIVLAIGDDQQRLLGMFSVLRQIVSGGHHGVVD